MQSCGVFVPLNFIHQNYLFLSSIYLQLKRKEIKELNDTEFRASTSISSELNRLIREIETKNAVTSDFYEELQTLVSYLTTSDSKSESIDEKKQRLKRIGLIVEELKEKYWDLTDLLTELTGIEILKSNLAEEGNQISRELIGVLKQMEPSIRNAYKSLRSSELGSMEKDLDELVHDNRFSKLNEVLKELFSKIETLSTQIEDLKQKRIL